MPAIAMANTKIELKNNWQVQPATRVKQFPKDNDWGKWGLRKWQKQRRPKKLSWSKINVKKVHSIWLKTSFEVPKKWGKSRMFLDFTRINGNAIVFVNGKKAGERLGPYGEIEITPLVKFGQPNKLLIFNTRNYTDVSRKMETDYIRYYSRGPGALYGTLPLWRHALGIDAPVYLVRYPVPAAIRDCWTVTSFRHKQISIPVKMDLSSVVENYSLTADIYDAEWKKVLSMTKKCPSIPSGESTVILKKTWNNPKLWELDGGYLYTAKVLIHNSAGRIVDQDSFQFGFREIWTEGRKLMINGHAMRWRVEWSSFGINANSISFLKLLGRNMIYYQSNPTGWWRDRAEVFYYDPQKLALCDQNGIAVLLPLPCANYGREAMLKNEVFYKQYMQEVKAFYHRYRRHPAIIGWCMSMNSFNPMDGIHPKTMGRRRKYEHVQAKVLEKVIADVKKLDPTRLVYAHAEGNLGDIASVKSIL